MRKPRQLGVSTKLKLRSPAPENCGAVKEVVAKPTGGHVGGGYSSGGTYRTREGRSDAHQVGTHWLDGVFSPGQKTNQGRDQN